MSDIQIIVFFSLAIGCVVGLICGIYIGIELKKGNYREVVKESETMISIIKKVDIKNTSFTNEECVIIDMIKGEQGWDG